MRSHNDVVKLPSTKRAARTMFARSFLDEALAGLQVSPPTANRSTTNLTQGVQRNTAVRRPMSPASLYAASELLGLDVALNFRRLCSRFLGSAMLC